MPRDELLVSGGFALLSFLAIESEHRAGTLRRVPVQDARLRRRLRAVRDPAAEFSGVTQAFWEWLKVLSESADPSRGRFSRADRDPSGPDDAHVEITTVRAMVDEAEQQVEALTPAALAEEMSRTRVTLVDLREQNERVLHGVIASSIHAPRGMLEFWADISSPHHRPELKPEARVVLHCAAGARSALAALTLKQLGYESVAHLAGGFHAWKEAQLPVQPVAACPEAPAHPIASS